MGIQFTGRYRIFEMKNKPLYEREQIKQPFIHSQFPAYISSHRNTTSSADFSLDKHFRRMSPAVHQRFSHVPNQLLRSVPTYPSNDYQLHPIATDLKVAVENSDSGKIIKQLITRIQRLQGRAQKWQKLEHRVQRLEGNTLKMSFKIQAFEQKKEDCLKEKENIVYSENKQQELKVRSKLEYVTKDELQKQLSGLDAAFKSLLTSFRTSINAEVGDYNMKNKKKFIQITATHLSEKLEQFKSNFLKEWNCQIQAIVKDTWSRELVGKSVLGLSKHQFLGSAVPLRLRQEITVEMEGLSRQITRLQTMYYLDREGRLLDKDMHYLLDSEGRQVRLEEQKIDKLRKEGILKEVVKEAAHYRLAPAEQLTNK